jgi:hypothetical protein
VLQPDIASVDGEESSACAWGEEPATQRNHLLAVGPLRKQSAPLRTGPCLYVCAHALAGNVGSMSWLQLLAPCSYCKCVCGQPHVFMCVFHVLVAGNVGSMSWLLLCVPPQSLLQAQSFSPCTFSPQKY